MADVNHVAQVTFTAILALFLLSLFFHGSYTQEAELGGAPSRSVTASRQNFIQPVLRRNVMKVRAIPPPSAPDQNEAQEGLKAMQQSVQKLNPEIVNSGGLLIKTQPENGKDMFRELLGGTYVSVDFDRFDQMRLLNVEPPILRLPGFLSPEECESLIASATGVVDAEEGRKEARVGPEAGILKKIQQVFFLEQVTKMMN
ncbi:hypothetical protein AAMO2058_000536900 [Amorphochlora amoebiformis]